MKRCKLSVPQYLQNPAEGRFCPSKQRPNPIEDSLLSFRWKMPSPNRSANIHLNRHWEKNYNLKFPFTAQYPPGVTFQAIHKTNCLTQTHFNGLVSQTKQEPQTQLPDSALIYRQIMHPNVNYKCIHHISFPLRILGAG